MNFLDTVVLDVVWHTTPFIMKINSRKKIVLIDLSYHTLCLGFLHLHEIVEGLYFHYTLSVCVSVCQ